MSASTIDTRVVEMQFDNRQFEKNVSQSMSTLDKLKAKLANMESSKSLEGLSNSINNIDTTSIVKSLDKIESRFSTMGIVGMTIVQNLTNSAISGLENVSSYMLNLVKTGGLSRALKIEAAKFSLEGLGETWEKVSAQISFAVNDTAYGLDEAASATSSLIASGVSVGNVAKQITELGEAGEMGTDYIDSLGMALKAISGVAAQTNSDYSSMANIFTTIAGQGKLMTMQLNQLANRGLNAAAILGKSLGKTEAEVREMVTDGEIDFATFAEVMYDNFADHAAAANKTLTGVKSNIKSAFSKIGADIFTPIIKNEGPLVKMLDTIRAKLNELRKDMDDAGQFESNLSYVAVQAINNIKYALDKIDVQSIADKLNTVGKSIQRVGQYLLTSSPITASMFRNTLLPLFNESTDSLNTFEEKLIESGSALTGWDISQLVKDSGSFMASLSSGWLTSDVLQRTLAYALEFVDAYDEGTLEATDANKKEYKEMKKLITLYHSGIEPLTEFYNILTQPTALDQLGKSFSNVFSGIKMVLNSMMTAWKNIFNSDYSGIVLNIANGIEALTERFAYNETTSNNLTRTFQGLFAVLDVIRDIIESKLIFVFTILKTAMGDTSADITGLTGNVGDMLVSFRDWYMANTNLTESAVTLGTKIGGAIKKIGDWTKAIAKSKIVNSTIEAFKTIVSTTYNVAKPIFEGIEEAFTGFLENLKELQGMDISSIGELFVALAGIILGALSSIYTGISNALPNSFSALLEGFNTLLGNIGINANKAKGGLKGIGSGISEFFSAIKWGDLAALLAVVAEMYTVFKMVQLVGKILEPLKMFQGLLDALASTVLSLKRVFIGAVFIEIAASISILASAMGKLADLDTATLLKSLGALAALATIMTLLDFVISKFPTADVLGGAITFGAMGVALAGLAGGILLLEKAMKNGNFSRAMITITELMLSMTLISALLSKLAPELSKGGLVLLEFAGSMLILAVTMNLIAILPINKINDNLLSVMGLFASLAAMMAVARIAGANAGKFGAGMLAVSVAMLALVGVILIINNIHIQDIANGIEMIGLIGGLFTVFATAARIGGQYAAKAGVGLLAMAGALTLMTGLIVIISWISEDSLKKGLSVLGLMTAMLDTMLISLAIVTATQDSDGLENASKIIKAICVAMIIMLVGIAALAVFDSKSILAASAAIAASSAGISLMILALAKTKNIKLKDNISRVDDLITIIGAMGVMGLALVTLSRLVTDPTKVIALSASMAICITSLAASMKIIDKVKINKSCDDALYSMMTAIIAIGGVLTVMALLFTATGSSIENLIAVSSGISIIMLSLGATMRVLNGIKISSTIYNNIRKFIPILIVLGGVFGVLAPFLSYSGASIDQILSAAAGIGIIMVAFGASLKLLNHVSINKSVYDNLKQFSVVIVAIGAALAVVSHFSKDATSTIAAAGAISICLGALTACAIAMGVFEKFASPTDMSGAASSLIVMGVALAGIATILAIFNNFAGDTSNIIKEAVALSILLGTLTVCASALLVLGDALEAGMVGLVAGLAGLVVMELAMLGLIGLMAALEHWTSNPEKDIKILESLTVMVVALTACIAVLSIFGNLCLGIAVGVKAIAACELLILGLVGIIAIIDRMGNISTAMSVLGQLTGIIVILSTVVVQLSAMGTGCIAAIVGVVLLGALISEFAIVMNTLGSLFTLFSGMEGVMQKGIDALKLIGSGIGEFLGNLVGGALDGIGDYLPEFGQALGEFYKGAEPFFEGISKIPANAGTAMKDIGLGLLGLFGAELLDKISSGIFGTTNMEDFCGNLQYLGQGLAGFVTGAGNVNTTDIESKANAISTLIGALAKMPKEGGWLQNITGTQKDLKDYATGMVEMGSVLVDFNDMEDINTDRIESVADAMATLIKAANNVPRTGGFLQDFIGEKEDLREFAVELTEGAGKLNTSGTFDTTATIGEALVQISKIGGDIDSDNIANAANGVSALATAANSMPDTGGVLQNFIGEKEDLREFASSLAGTSDDGTDSIGASLQLLSEQGANINVENIKNAASGITALEESLPESTSTIEKFFVGGTTDMGTFGEQLHLFGVGVSDFNTDISGIDASSITRMNCLSNFISGLVNSMSMVSFADGGNGTDIEQFSNKIEDFGESMVTFSDTVAGIKPNSIAQFKSSVDSLVEGFRKAAEASNGDFDSASQMLNTSAKDIVTNFTDSINGPEATTKIKFAVQGLFDAVAANIKSYGLSTIKGATNTVLYAITGLVSGDSTNLYTSRAIQCGQYLIQGLTNGLNNEDSTSALYQAAEDIVNNVLNKMTETADEHSPSKKTALIGQYLSEGLGNGIKEYGSYATSAATGVTNDILAAMQTSVNSISSLLSDDMEVTPTISPVMDLTGIQNGITSMNSMVNGQSFAVNTSMNASSIAGLNAGSGVSSTDSIIAKLNELGSQLSSLSSPTYNIDGITYSDGTEVSNAIKSLVRAAKIERRMNS